MNFNCVIFDLDGTLVDSRVDLANAVDAALVTHALPAQGIDRVMTMVGEGARVLVTKAVASAGGEASMIDAVLASFMVEYKRNHLENTSLYPGALEALEGLRSIDVRCAVVSNKPFEFTASILEHLGVARHLSVIFGGDSRPERKPHPSPLLDAIELCESIPARSAIVGDGIPDMVAGGAAGILRIGCSFGLTREQDLVDAGADLIIHSLADLVPTLHNL